MFRWKLRNTGAFPIWLLLTPGLVALPVSVLAEMTVGPGSNVQSSGLTSPEKNRPPVIREVSTSTYVTEGQRFEVRISASDDRGLLAIIVEFEGAVRRIDARGRTSLTLTTTLLAGSPGYALLRVSAVDEERQASPVYRQSLSVRPRRKAPVQKDNRSPVASKRLSDIATPILTYSGRSETPEGVSTGMLTYSGAAIRQTETRIGQAGEAEIVTAMLQYSGSIAIESPGWLPSMPPGKISTARLFYSGTNDRLSAPGSPADMENAPVSAITTRVLIYTGAGAETITELQSGDE